MAELRANPRVAAVFYWPSLGRQVRVEGRGEVAERELAEELFAEPAARPSAAGPRLPSGRGDRELEPLRERFEQFDAELAEGPVPCPADWGAVGSSPSGSSSGRKPRTAFTAPPLADEAGEWRHSLLAP